MDRGSDLDVPCVTDRIFFILEESSTPVWELPCDFSLFYYIRKSLSISASSLPFRVFLTSVSYGNSYLM